jgi:hypothetical protein
MPCEHLKMSDGGVAIVCTARRAQKKCRLCGAQAVILCDWRDPADSDASSCNKPLCMRCAVHVAEDVDFCPDHRAPAPARQGVLAL